MRIGIAVAGIAVALALPASAGAANASYTFDAGSQGWQSTGVGSCQTTATPDWFGGGYISETDDIPGDDCFWVLSPPPAQVGGNLKANYGGSVSFDLRHPPDAAFPARIYIVGTNGVTLSASGGPLTGGWDTTTLPINETTFSDDGSGEPMDRALLFDTLASVQAVQILADYSYGDGQTTDVDNFTITEASPPRDEDGDGLLNAVDGCPVQPGLAEANGCPPQTDPAGSDSCKKAKKKLAKAKAKLRKLRQKDARAAAIAKAKQKVKKAKKAKKKACSSDTPDPVGPPDPPPGPEEEEPPPEGLVRP